MYLHTTKVLVVYHVRSDGAGPARELQTLLCILLRFLCLCAEVNALLWWSSQVDIFFISVNCLSEFVATSKSFLPSLATSPQWFSSYSHDKIHFISLCLGSRILFNILYLYSSLLLISLSWIFLRLLHAYASWILICIWITCGVDSVGLGWGLTFCILRGSLLLSMLLVQKISL
jgi:hypothetical protein